MILGVVVALSSATFYGVSDYLASAAARRVRVLPATSMSYLLATLVIMIMLPVFGGVWSWAATLWGALAGVCAVIGFLTFYGAMASGPMSLMSPLMATLQSAVPVVVAVVLGEGLGVWGWVGIGLAVCAGALISAAPRGGARIAPLPLLLAVIAGVSLGLSVVALDMAPSGAGLTSGAVEMIVGVVLLGVLVVLSRTVARVRSATSLLDAGTVPVESTALRATVLLAGAGGVLLGGANALLIFALHAAPLAMVSVLVGLYPLATILLARVLLGEHLSAAQIGGVALAITAAAVLAVS